MVNMDKLSPGKKAIITFLVFSLVFPYLIKESGGEESGDLIRQPADYNIFSRMTSVEKEISNRMEPPEILNYTKQALPSGVWIEHPIGSDFMQGYQLQEQEVSLPHLPQPLIIGEIKKNPRANYTTLLDWILPQPISEGSLNFGVMTYQEGHINWKLASIIPRVLFTDSDLSRWVYIDTDNSTDTGDDLGRDIRVRLGVTQARVTFQRPTIVPPTPGSVTFERFAISMEVEALGNPNNSPLQIYVVKAISYSGKNYLWCIGASPDHPPGRLVLTITTERIVGRLREGGFLNFPPNIFSGNFSFIDVAGPYYISYRTSEDLESLTPSVTMINIVERVIKGYTHLVGVLTPSTGYNHIPLSGLLTLDFKDLTSPITDLSWGGGGEGELGIPCRLDLTYREDREDKLYAVAKISDLPPKLVIHLNYHSVSGRNVTDLKYTSSTPVGRVAFHEEILPKDGSPVVTTLLLKELPTRLHLSTTGGVPFSSNITFPMNASLGVIGSILDGFLGKISERFGRIGAALRALPRGVADLPQNRGWLEMDGNEVVGEVFYASGDVNYLTTSSNYLSVYQRSMDSKATLSIKLKGIVKGGLNFSQGFDVHLTSEERDKLEIAGIIPGGETLMSVEEAPRELRIFQNEDGNHILLHLSEKVEEIHLLGRRGEEALEGIIKGIVGEGVIRKEEGSIEVLFDSPVDSFQIYLSNSNRYTPRFYPIPNFINSVQSGKEGQISLRLQRINSLRFIRGENPIIELKSSGAGDLLIDMVEEETSLTLKGAFKPLPNLINLTLPTNLTSVELPIPSLTTGNFTGLAEALLSLVDLTETLLNLTYRALSSMVERLGYIGQSMNMNWEASGGEGSDLLLHFQRLGSSPFKPAHWTHGVWIYQSGLGSEASLDMKVFLRGLPLSGSLSFSFTEETLRFMLSFTDYSPEEPWLLVRTEGFQKRDITIYLSDIKPNINMEVEAEITTNMSIGGRIIATMKSRVTKTDGSPVDLGEVLARLRKLGEEPSLREIFMPSLPSNFSFYGRMEQDIEVEYSSSEYLEFIYIKLAKFLGGRWSQIYGIFHDLPLSFSATIKSNPDITLKKPLPLQGFPTFQLNTTGREIDLYINYDGRGVGQRGRYQLFIENAGSTRTYYEGNKYVIKSSGVEYAAMEMKDLPYMEGFELKSLFLVGMGIKSIRMDVQIYPGGLPVIILDRLKVRNVKVQMNMVINSAGIEMNPEGSFYVYKVSSEGFVHSLSLIMGPLDLNLKGCEKVVIAPAPGVILWSEILGGGGG
ncbi:MAG: hypothetical protein J7L88_01465 [Thermoplasmata archaeon]|nr:hypothetical protein [Thermoplasmata archaeon]